MPRWSVDLIRKTKLHLGTVVAANEADAIKQAIKQFRIASARQFKITVTKISERDD
jgi:hypothetical protein